jgi:hypothetical protein
MNRHVIHSMDRRSETSRIMTGVVMPGVGEGRDREPGCGELGTAHDHRDHPVVTRNNMKQGEFAPM